VSEFIPLSATSRSQRGLEGANRQAGKRSSALRGCDDLAESRAGQRGGETLAGRSALCRRQLAREIAKKKKLVLDRPPLERPSTANQALSIDFLFDRMAEGHLTNSLSVVDDTTHEAGGTVPERAIGGIQLIRALDQSAKTRGLPKAILTDSVKNLLLPCHADLGAFRWCQLFPLNPESPTRLPTSNRLMGASRIGI
jgi:hypothetical protein